MKGLSSFEAKERLKKYGLNEFSKHEKRSFYTILVEQLKNPLLILLLIASVISFFIGQELESYAIIIAVFLSALFGSYLEFKADKSLEELRKYSQIKSIVIRDGENRLIDARYIVPGDIVIVEAGSIIPSDGIIIESNEFSVDESILTGESRSVYKKKGDKVFAGTVVLSGYAKFKTTKTGFNTEFGKIAKSLSSIEEGESELKKKVRELSRKVSLISITIIIILLAIGILRGFEIVELFIFSVTLAVAAIPEGLLTVLTIILALGVKEMAKHNALVRRLSAIDGLGMVDVIATDKTGTITEGKLKLVEYDDERLLKLSALCTLTKKTENGWVGDEVDVAIMEKVKDLRVKECRKIRKIIPFSPERKFMSIICEKGIITKGAPEIVLKGIKFFRGKKITPYLRRRINERLNKLTSKGLRVLAVRLNDSFEGFLGFEDPLKKGVRETVKKAYESGIDIYMITGDNIKTALAIARKAGIKGEGDVWSNLKKLSDVELFEKLKTVKIIGRAPPLSKLRIVEVLQMHGKRVAVTGDGVNDAPALKKATVGIAMGKKGTEVSKQVADVVLLDDNFSTIMEAIKYGRTTFFNILNFIRFQLTTNIAAIGLTTFSFFSMLPLPLKPLQLLWINLIMDGPPALAQGFETAKEEVLKLKPRKSSELLTKNVMAMILTSGLFMAFMSYLAFTKYMPFYDKAVTMAFNMFVFFQLYNAFNCRSIKEHFWENILSNKLLLGSVVLTFIVQILINIHPFTSKLFGLSPLTTNEWLLVILLPLTIFVLDEVRKAVDLWTSV